MISLKELPLIFLLCFTLIYSTIGNPDSAVWSGLYFVANYLTLLCLFRSHRSKTIRRIGISLSVSILIFIVLKYFIHIECSRIFTFIPFTICLIGLILIDNNEPRNRKNI